MLPGGATLAAGERILVDDQFMYSTVAFYLRTDLTLTNRRLYAMRPNTLLGLIPVGTTRSNFPIENIAGVNSGTRFAIGGVLIGIVALLVGIGALALPGALVLAILLIVVGLSSIIGAPKQAIEVMNSGGGRILFQVSVLDRGRTLAFASAVSEAIARSSRPTDRGSSPMVSVEATDAGKALRNLETLRNDGLITEDEYTAKRAEVLRRL